MDEPSPKRRHHINPRFYLRDFQCPDAERYLWRYDNEDGTGLCLPLNNASVERDYYSYVNPSGLRDTELVENFIADIEGITAPVVRKFLDSDTLIEQDRMTLAFFVSLSYARAPATRRQAAESMSGMLKIISRAEAMDPDYYRRSYREMENSKNIPDKDRISDEEIENTRQFILDGQYQINLSEQVTLLPLAHIESIAHIIYDMKWTVLEAAEGISFITSDSPVARGLPPSRLRPLAGPGFTNLDIEVTLPVSPQKTLLATWHEKLPDHVTVPKE